MKHKILTCIFSVMLTLFSFISCYANSDSISDKTIQKLLTDFRTQSKAPAAVLSINYPDNKISNYVSGTVLKVSSKNPNPPTVTTHNLFQIGSITKSFTAAIILQLEAEGKLSINDTIFDITQKYGSWLPAKEYAAWKNITIKQLLNMTSGIFEITEDKTFMNIMAKYPQKNWTPEEVLKYASKHKPDFAPGKGWHYTNGAYNVLGILIEKITQQPYEKVINERILKKYALANTYYSSNEYAKKIMQRMAHGYVYAGGGFSPPLKSGADMTYFNLSPAGPSGALVSNSIDISQWIRKIFTGQVLPSAQLNEMLTAVCSDKKSVCKPGEVLPSDSHSNGFSLGLMRTYDPQLGVIWVYLGETPGYSSGFLWLPKKNIALAMTITATSTNSHKLVGVLAEIARLQN